MTRNTIEFEWTKSVSEWGRLSMKAMRLRLSKHFHSEYSDKTALSRLIDMKIDKMITSGETLQLPEIDYRYIPSTETEKR